MTPLFLRVALAVVFLWSGIGKLQPMEYTPAQAATLANMGVAAFAQAAATSGGSGTNGAADGADNATAKPDQARISPNGLLPLVQTDQEQSEQPAENEPPKTKGAEPAATSSEEPPPTNKAATPPSDDSRAGLAAPAPTFTVADYAGPVTGRALFAIALSIDASAHPADGAKAIWPASLAKGSQPAWIARAIMITEIAGGVMALVGALVRLAGLALAGVMVGAAWLTSIGPYAIGGKAGFIHILPPVSEFSAWQTWTLQLTVFCAAIGLLFAGAGALSVDRLVFGPLGEKTTKITDDDAD